MNEDDESFTKEFWKSEAIRWKELAEVFRKERDAFRDGQHRLYEKLERIAEVLET